MKLDIFSVYDEKASYYSRPFTNRTISEAIRSFATACMDPETPFNHYPADFTLYKIGAFDDATGEISPITPIPLTKSSEVLARVINDRESVDTLKEEE